MKEQTSALQPYTTSLLASKDTSDLTPQVAWTQGTNIRQAMRANPKEVKMFLAVELKKLVEFVDAKKTLKNDEELVFTIESLVEEFPTMKLEEFALIF